MTALSDVVGAVGRVLWGISLVYMIVLMAAGVSESRRARLRRAGDQPADDGGRFDFYFLIAALNEAEVIGATVRSLSLEAPTARIVVVDDASDDGTGMLAAAAAPNQVLTVTRSFPDARRGKGPALNAGLVAVREDVRRRNLDPGRVIVVVMDADGHLSEGATSVVGSLFGADPEVGGVQLAVRIRNRGHILTKIQDHDFWGICGLTQIGRSRFGTVSLGGNGQFSRLSALDSIGTDPWSAALTEDLDLGISMAVAGWTAVSTPEAWVDQQGLTNLRALLRQRTRWFQGHMMAGRRIPEIWRSPKLSTAGCFEMCLYVISPWLFVVLWSVVIQLLYVELALDLARGGSSFYGSSVASKVVFGVGLYLISFAPIMIIGFVYYRRTEGVGLARAILYSHLSIGFQYFQYLAAWRALGRMVMRRNGWAKTSRQVETVPEPLPVGSETAAPNPNPGLALAPSGPTLTRIRLIEPPQTLCAADTDRLYSGYSPDERAVLRSLALSGSGPRAEGRLLELPAGTATLARPMVPDEEELIWPDGGLCLVDPLFADWIRNRFAS